MNILNTRKQLIAIALGAALTIPALSMAATMPQNNDNNRIIVSFSDLNLSNDKGVETLYQRIKVGARQFCGTVSPRQLNLYRLNKECVNRAIADAVESIDNEKLKQLHSS